MKQLPVLPKRLVALSGIHFEFPNLKEKVSANFSLEAPSLVRSRPLG
jgi:hypothetical protein